MLAWIAEDSNVNPLPMSSDGWTYKDGKYNASNFQCALLWKRASSESGNYTFTPNQSVDNMVGRIAVYRGFAASGDPIHAWSNTTYQTSNTNVRAASVDTTVPTWLVHLGVSYSRTITPPNGYTERFDSYGTEGTALYCSDKDCAAWTGTTGVVDAVISGTAYTLKHAMLVALTLEGATTYFIPSIMQTHIIPSLGG
jgi:hypothetical protein